VSPEHVLTFTIGILIGVVIVLAAYFLVLA
jgi:hypothetical protein